MLGAKYDWELAEQGQFRNCTCFRITQSQKDTVSLLLQKGADPDYGAGWLLLVAVQQQDDALLQLLLDAGASVVEPALHIAAVYRSAAFIGKLLSTAKGPVDQDGAALAAAAQSCDVTVVRMLLDHGANVNAALQTVTANDNARAVMMLLSQSTARIADMDLLKVLLDMAPQQHSSGIWWHSRMAAWTVGQ
jgi:ankyrin repeat protein